MTAECVACESSEFENLETAFVDRRKGLRGSWKLHRCRKCRLMSIFPLPSYRELESYYGAYGHDVSEPAKLGAGWRYPVLRRIFHALTGDVDPRDFIKPPPDSLVLDFGCGAGTYLRDFSERGHRVIGAEISSPMVERCVALGLDVRHVPDLSAVPFTDSQFDVVYLMQVFEHLREPEVFMKELCRITRDGGELWIAVPNFDSIWRRVFRANWVSGWFPPFHLYHYRRENIAQLAARYGAKLMDSWSMTPESWFRLNFRAWMRSSDSELEKHRASINPLARVAVGIPVRLMDLLTRRGDCLVVRFKIYK